MPLKPSWHLLGRPSATDPEGSVDAWQVLDDFLRQLQAQQNSSRQGRILLATLQTMTRADLVFACSTEEEGTIDQCGPIQQPAEQCREILRQLLAMKPEADGHLISQPPAPAPSVSVFPQSAALLRLSKSRRVWIVALVFGKDRTLHKSDIHLMRFTRRLLQQQNRQAQIFSQLKDTLLSLVRCLTATLDARDPYTWGHSERVARMAVRIAQEIGVSDFDTSDLYLGGLLHDIGKIGVPDEVLRKPGVLTAEERTHVEKHPVIGEAILKHVSHLAHLRPAVRHHHERYDGQGYPDRLAGTGIPYPARILAVADACDAMLSDRPYRKGMPIERIEQIFQQGAGSQWDPQIVEFFFRCQSDVYAIHQRGLGDSVIRAVEQALHGTDREGTAASMTAFSFREQDPEA